MTIKTATPNDTFGHIFGSGFEQYSWWYSIEYTGVDFETWTAQDDWTATVEIEDPNDDEATITKTVTHKDIMRIARAIVQDAKNGTERKWGGTEKYGASSVVVHECKHLILNVDETDFDAPAADEIVQSIMFDKVVYC